MTHKNFIQSGSCIFKTIGCLFSFLLFILVVGTVFFLYFYKGGNSYFDTPSGRNFEAKIKPVHTSSQHKTNKQETDSKQNKNNKSEVGKNLNNAFEVSLDELFKVYNENKYAFNLKYKNKYLKISGSVQEVEADEKNVPHIKVFGGIGKTLVVDLVKNQESLAINLKKGDNRTAIGYLEKIEETFLSQQAFLRNSSIIIQPEQREFSKETPVDKKE